MPTVFDLCQPRKDVLEGRLRDEEFAADLSKVVKRIAAAEYQDPEVFFRNTHPTRGLKKLLETVCRRLSGKGGDLNSVLRLDTQYGGGKTHSLIALVHAANGMSGVERPDEFVDPALLPQGPVRVAALDGENADPANGLQLEPGLLARSLWGEMAYRLAGRKGYERVRSSDERHAAPGADTIAELFGDEPTLILIDEVSVYLRKVAQAFPAATNQFAAFLQALIKAVSSTPRAALVLTLAIRSKDQEAADAYKQEHQLALQAFEEAESVAARKLLQLDPTEEDETVDVLRRRLFESVNLTKAGDQVREYAALWDRNRDSFPAVGPEVRDQFRKGYPFHPETLGVLTKKLSSLANFHRIRGMVRLLARTVKRLWDTRPPDAWAIHPHHIDLGYGPIREEILTRLGQAAYAPALSADAASVTGKEPSVAQRLDQEQFAGQPPVTAYLARTVFLHTMAFGDAAQGITPDHLRFSIASPAIEPSFVEAARRRFIPESLYLDDRPGVPLRFRVEPNLNQVVQRAMREIDPDEVRKVLNDMIRSLFTVRSGDFEMIPFPGGPYEIPDDVGNGRPYLVILNYDAYAFADGTAEPAPDLVRMAMRAGAKEEHRKLQNNVVFAVADQRLAEEMKLQVRRRLALQAIADSERFQELPEHQQRRVKEEVEKSLATTAISILQCYRHLFYPSGSAGSDARLGHTTIELHNASESPGNGQLHIKRALESQKKLLGRESPPDAPTFVRDQTPLKTKGEISTADLRSEYRKAPKLSILLDDAPLIACIRQGIDQGVFIYREGKIVWGKDDPAPSISVSDNAFVHTVDDARRRNLWPRPRPERREEEVDDAGGISRDRLSTPTPSTGMGGSAGTATRGPRLTKDGPIREALSWVFEQARKEKVAALASIRIKFYEHRGAFALHQALASYRDAVVSVDFKIHLEDEDVRTYEVVFDGAYAKATGVKSIMERPMQAARECRFEGSYRLDFTKPLSTAAAVADAFISTVTKFGGAEAYIEAEAAAAEKS